MALSPQTATLVANTVATMTFNEDFAQIEVSNITGDAVVYFRFDGIDPVIAAAGCYVLRAEKGAVTIKPKTSSASVVKFISAGTPTVNARGINP